MKLNSPSKWTVLSIKVIILFTITMFLTFLPDHIRDFFGDTAKKPDAWYFERHQEIRYSGNDLVDEAWYWGWRHYLYFTMCLVLFGIQAARIINWVSRNSKEFK